MVHDTKRILTKQQREKAQAAAKLAAEKQAAAVKAQKIKDAEAAVKSLEMKKKNAQIAEKSSASDIQKTDKEIVAANKKLAELKK